MRGKHSLNSLARNVADMSATCRRHVHMSPLSRRHFVSLRHRRGPDIPVTVFFTSLNLLYYTYEKYWFDEFLPEIRNCTSYAGVCRAYLIVHLKCTRKSSKMLCEGISSRSLLPAIPNHNLFFHTSFFLSSVSFFRIVLSFGYIISLK